MYKNRVYLHIYPCKNGTSIHEKYVFQKLFKIFFIPFSEEYEVRGLCKYICYDRVYFGGGELSAVFSSVIRLAQGSISVLLFREHVLHDAFDRGEILHRLRAVFGDVHIIMFAHNQFNWIESSYLWKLRGIRAPWAGGLLPRCLDDYLAGQWGSLYRGRFNGRLPSADYGTIAQKLINMFGRDNVHVFLFESMVHRSEYFADKFFPLLENDSDVGATLLAGKRRNPRLTRARLIYWKAKTNFIPLGMARMLATVPWDVSRLLERGDKAEENGFSLHWRRILSEFCAPGNRFLADTFGLDLARWDYPLDTTPA